MLDTLLKEGTIKDYDYDTTKPDSNWLAEPTTWRQFIITTNRKHYISFATKHTGDINRKILGMFIDGVPFSAGTNTIDLVYEFFKDILGYRDADSTELKQVYHRGLNVELEHINLRMSIKAIYDELKAKDKME